jgi:hypothetical protein
MPHGAFYVFPNITGTGLDLERDRRPDLLYDAGVCVPLRHRLRPRYGEGPRALQLRQLAREPAPRARAVAESLAKLPAHAGELSGSAGKRLGPTGQGLRRARHSRASASVR